MKRNNINVSFFLLFILFISAMTRYTTLANTPEIRNEQGKVISESIASLEKVKIGGIDQWLLLRGKSRNNPILLILHGGPGSPEGPLFAHYNKELEEHFLIVNWDQRGSGKSFNNDIPLETMNIKQFISDTLEIIELLRKRFNQNKVFLLGHSWGSYLGVLTVQRYPELFLAYIGVGQLVNAYENERISFHYTWEKAVENNKEKAMVELKKINIPEPYGNIDQEGTWYKQMKTQRQWLLKFGGCIYKKKNYNEWVKIIIKRPEYSLKDCIKWLKGNSFSIKAMWPEIIKECNLFKQAPELDVPVYFFIGRHDYNTPGELVERYFNHLEAPKKELIWFENSAHSPMFEEPQEFNKMMIKIRNSWHPNHHSKFSP